MKKRPFIVSMFMSGYTAALLLWPVIAVADDALLPPPPPGQAPLITEVQTGTPSSGAEEFVKIYNPARQAVDLSRWQLQIANATAADWQTPHRSIPLSGELGAGASLVVASRYVKDGAEVRYLPEAPVRFSAGLSASAGGARLVYAVYRLQADGVCTLSEAIADEVHWKDVPPTASWQRSLSADGTYEGSVLLTDACENLTLEPVPSATIVPPEPTSAVPPPLPQAVNQGLLAPQLSELLPNPAAPLSDADGEFVELYNPNDVVFDLGGFELRTGLKGTYRYVFPAGTHLPPKQFVSFMAKDTRLVLSNTAGKAVLSDPYGTVVAESEPYGKAAAGQAWVYADGVWRWTVQPSQSALNTLAAAPPPVQKAPAVKAAKAAATSKAAVRAVKTAAVPKEKPKAVLPEPVKKETAATVAPPPANPLHPGALAAAAVLAVLYGAYEYRHDVANKLHRFRTNRAARRAVGQSIKGR